MKSLDQITQLVGTKSLKNLNYELQNADYEGCTFQIGETMFRSRLAKLTPKRKDILLLSGKKTLIIKISLFYLIIALIN